MSNENLSERMKEYENVFRYYLPKRTNVMIRIDGKSFHRYTKNCKKPFDDDLMDAMDKTAIALCEEIQNVKCAYIQSDEISLWAAPYDNLESQPWFQNNLQKIVSVSASIATSSFNKIRALQHFEKIIELNDIDIDKLSKEEAKKYVSNYEDFNSAIFDSRSWIIPSLSEVANAFKWRSDDASRNSVQMVARSLYSHDECENKSCAELQEMIFQKSGQNWNDLQPRYKRGRIVTKEYADETIEFKNGSTITFNHGKWKVKDLQGYDFNYWFGLINKILEEKKGIIK